MKEIIHQHIIIKAYVTNPPMSEKSLEDWFYELVSEIKMKVCIPPRARYVNTVGNRRVTGICGIETSHVALHCWDELTPAMIQMDVYSCAPFHKNQILKQLEKFGLVKYELMEIDRNKSFIVTNHEISNIT